MFKNYFYNKFLPRIIQEAVFSSAAIVYHRTRENPENYNIHEKGIDISKNENSMYGKGLYTTYTLESQDNDRMRELYGNYILKGKINLSNMLILDKSVFNSVHPREDFNDYLIREGINENIINDIKSNEFTSNAAHRVWRRFYTKKDGIVFTGQSDGKVVVVWNPKIFLAISYSEDDGKTWKKLNTNIKNVKSAEDNRQSAEIDLNYWLLSLEDEFKMGIRNQISTNIVNYFLNYGEIMHIFKFAKMLIRNGIDVPDKINSELLDDNNFIFRTPYLEILRDNNIELSDIILTKLNYNNLLKYAEELINDNKEIPDKITYALISKAMKSEYTDYLIDEYIQLLSQNNIPIPQKLITFKLSN